MSSRTADVEKKMAIVYRALDQAADDALEDAAMVCVQMVVGGRAWTHDQQVAADALFAAAANIRALKTQSSQSKSE